MFYEWLFFLGGVGRCGACAVCPRDIYAVCFPGQDAVCARCGDFNGRGGAFLEVGQHTDLFHMAAVFFAEQLLGILLPPQSVFKAVLGAQPGRLIYSPLEDITGTTAVQKQQAQ